MAASLRKCLNADIDMVAAVLLNAGSQVHVDRQAILGVADGDAWGYGRYVIVYNHSYVRS